MTRHHEPGVMTGISLLLPITLTTMAIVLLAPIVPALMVQFKDVPHHEYWVPMILTLPALCSAILCPFAGMAGDYFGRRQLLIASFVLYAIMGVAPVFLSDLTWILASRVGVFRFITGRVARQMACGADGLCVDVGAAILQSGRVAGGIGLAHAVLGLSVCLDHAGAGAGIHMGAVARRCR